jgi:putative transposase
VADEDYGYYLDNLKEWKKELGCKVYAYCLMTNHVHLLIDPGENEENLGLLMKRISGRQTRYVNRLEKRSGTLWEGRFKSSPVSSSRYLLACCRYIEMNSLRAGIVDDPGKYRWSSFVVKTDESHKNRDWFDFDEHYMSFGNTPAERAEKYRKWTLQTIPDAEIKLIRESVNRGHVTGDSRFVEDIEKRIGRRLVLRRQGRPRK